jgi:hypothetical protein
MLETQLNFADLFHHMCTGKTEKLVYQTLADCGLPNEKGQSIDPAAFTFDVFYQIYQAICPRYIANEGPVRIQYKCLVPIYVFPEMKLLFQKQNYDVLSPSSYTLIYL